MKVTRFFVIVTIGLWLLLGCGGGGSVPGSGTSANLAPGQYIEFLSSGGAWIDPFNLSIGSTGTAVLANYDGLGTRTVLPTSAWGTTAGGGLINVNSSTGAFTVLAAPAGEFKFQTTATIGGTPTLFEQRGRVPLATDQVAGRYTEINLFTGFPSNTGIPHLNVDFFNSVGTLVGSARTMANGRFTARVPTTATHMMVEASSIRINKFYRSIYYETRTYSPLDFACLISVSVTGGGTTTLSTGGIPLSSGSPPPPPTGCS